MKDRILFWIDADLTHFGLAKYLLDQYDCDIYAVFDVTDKPKKFFEAQQIIKFQKIWFYHDHIHKTKNSPDITYLTKFEEKYNIKLQLIAHNERIFYNYNEYYKFNTDEIFRILEQECKFFEQVLDEIKPQFLIMRATDLQHNHIFYELCKAKGIKPLLLGQTRFAYRPLISPYWHQIDPITNNNDKEHDKTFDELLSYLRGTDLFKQSTDYVNQFQYSKLAKIKAISRFLFSNNSNPDTHYTYYGRTKLKVVIKTIVFLLKRKIREYFINKNLIRKITDETPFLYFPLHVDQESTLLLGAPFHTNQFELITNIIKSLPIGYQLYVKEHPIMRIRGWRRIAEYKQLLKLHGVKVIHPSVKPEEIIKKCSLVLSITSSASLEAAFYQKPSIIFADAPYSTLSSVCRIKNIEELPEAIKTMMKKTVDVKELNRYVDLVHSNSFHLDMIKFELGYAKYFYYNGNLVDVYIDSQRMISYLEEYRKEFEILAQEHVKKIQHYKKT